MWGSELIRRWLAQRAETVRHPVSKRRMGGSRETETEAISRVVTEGGGGNNDEKKNNDVMKASEITINPDD